MGSMSGLAILSCSYKEKYRKWTFLLLTCLLRFNFISNTYLQRKIKQYKGQKSDQWMFYILGQSEKLKIQKEKEFLRRKHYRHFHFKFRKNAGRMVSTVLWKYLIVVCLFWHKHSEERLFLLFYFVLLAFYLKNALIQDRWPSVELMSDIDPVIQI